MAHSRRLDRLDPIIRDTVPGTGGLGAGRFTIDAGDTLDINYQYVQPGYIIGQGGYIFGDRGTEN